MISATDAPSLWHEYYADPSTMIFIKHNTMMMILNEQLLMHSDDESSWYLQELY